MSTGAGAILGWFGESVRWQDMHASAGGLAGDPPAWPATAATADGVACIVGARTGDVWAAPGGVVGAFCGRPAWRDPDLKALAAEHGAARALVTAYDRHGDACLDRLHGDFAVVVADPARGRLMAATDRIGIQPLYYHATGAGVVFGTRLAQVVAHPAVGRALDPQAIYDYLYFHCIPSPGTVFRGVRKLAPAERYTWTRGSEAGATYWLPAGEGDERVADRNALEAEVRARIGQAVGEHARRRETMPGAFLSGGLDSSTVAGYLQEAAGGRAHTYTIGFGTTEYDESRYARLSADHFHTTHHEYHVTPRDVLDAVPRIAACFDEPFGNSSSVPVYYCAKFARDSGTTALLAGDGGDELFAGNERYATQHLFEQYFSVPAPIRTLAERTYELIPALQTLPLVRKGHRYIVQARVPLPDRLQRYNFMHRFQPAEVLAADLLPHVDTGAPLQALRRRYREPDTGSALNRMLYLDWKFTLADNDLVKVSRMCDLAGVGVSYPMLDDEVVELSWRIPAAWKMPGRRLRDFYKRSMQGFLPAATLTKSKHGFGLPFGVWLRDDAGLRELAADTLASLKERRLLQPAFLDQALALHRDDTAKYFGELVWILMMLELWLRGSRPGRP